MAKMEWTDLETKDAEVLQDMQRSLSRFVNEVNGLRGEVKADIKKVDDRMTVLDHKMKRAGRPYLAATNEDQSPHQLALTAYLRSGDDGDLRSVVPEVKGLTTAVNGDGGYLVDPQTAEAVQSVLRSAGSLRSVASVVTVEATSFDVLIDHSDIGSGWATETGSQSETASPTLDRISIPLHELSALPKASQRLLDDSAFDIESWLAQRIADKFSRAEAAAFISGDGLDKPRGLLTHTVVEDDLWSWGNIGYIATGEDAGLGNGDAIVDLVYAVGAQYRANGSFVMNSKTAGMIRKLKDADGRFLWSDGFAAAEPARLMGYPVLIAEDMPDVTSGSYSVAFGDFAAGYTIAERPDLRVLRDPFSAKPHVLFYATKRVGGDVSDFAAVKVLKFGLA